ATVLWPADSASPEAWLAAQPVDELKAQFDNDGYAVVRGVLTPSEVALLGELYDRLLSGSIDASSHRHDLGNTQAVQNAKFKENICQIMWPSLFVQGLADTCPARQRLRLLARALLGPDMDFDFDMMLAKPPQSNTPTPWHADAAYWLDMPDKRAVSCWLAVDATWLDNGCMWFGPGSHRRPLLPHRSAAAGTHVLTCDGSEADGVPCELQPGDCTLHSGQTLHYSRGNTSDCWRRGYVMNFRPLAMVEFERQRNYDHGQAGLGKIFGAGQAHAADGADAVA
uniref:Phytanoyl-CoA dioxygenase family protein n=1 Tax=Macrostomum lignano TaxID=282301 RepID=A0A1I8IXG9_9PLAT